MVFYQLSVSHSHSLSQLLLRLPTLSTASRHHVHPQQRELVKATDRSNAFLAALIVIGVLMINWMSGSGGLRGTATAFKSSFRVTQWTKAENPA